MVSNNTRISARRLVALTLLSAASFSALAGGGLSDDQAKKWFNDRGCNSCHEAVGQRIGPPYQIVAARYAAEYAADPQSSIEKLAVKIRYGGAGAWGSIPMISNPNVSQSEAESIATWILSLKMHDQK